ncbi:MAG: transporter substrate-binding domain-containing protein [Bacteroidales bacterium]|nr:transporter substrate-binding domain-containing protein [Bacteroidales bacterium]MDD2386942.1 transporter substrate-binding domain-containing protein [Bacteroidales bacterium]MDD4218019.1 transporter substrate-binding domain-containing protein [Bacteroidales bacterium]MDY0142759.1 transporter substrate-binding domain-containing protein [Bacteroidales bacterium]
MKNFKKLTIIVIIAILLLSIYLLVRFFAIHNQTVVNKRDYKEITASDTIIAVVSTNPLDYFIYQGQAMGFQLEILQDFAKHHNLNLKVIVENDLIKGMELLMKRKCDILAQSIIVTNERDLILEFSIPVRQTKQVLVQRKPDSFKSLTYNQLEDSLIRSPEGLKGKTLYAFKASINKIALQSLSLDLAENFFVQEIDSISVEQIIYYVSTGVFDYAVCDEGMAKITQVYYPNIDIKTELSLAQNIAWGIRPESVMLLDTVNAWLENFIQSSEYNKYSLRYFNNNRILVDINSEFYSGNGGKISNYDDIIKKYSHIIGWDWRLIASLIYEESRFNENAISWAGAYGLMQLMPFIYERFTPDTLSGNEAQIVGGLNYINFLYTKIPNNVQDSTTVIKMILAGYNVGFGHVDDAISLAEKYNKNSASWEVISHYMNNLANPKYFNDTCVKHGYIAGIYAVNFANNIVERFEHYKNVIPE